MIAWSFRRLAIVVDDCHCRFFYATYKMPFSPSPDEPQGLFFRVQARANPFLARLNSTSYRHSRSGQIEHQYRSLVVYSKHLEWIGLSSRY
ncbi:hypothetical protein ALO95_102352 [Pseudomonas syringae pv. antirrhini]|uniref:Uncharacterized protein n=1 Tax=Pseudomonas syringae pv. antirrhini TaxID=251702 RepID=A0A0N8QNT4_9PSED|nr:hypothetical protein ALO87_102586 [Pseudomonas syringae pv. apii]KPW48478.1 hypothetical protein ALO88_102786 [Pseudomonas syringae pv. antirrhini]RMR22245.1 hypothetical protein ALP89_102642 [Pseudomonas syringae pv. persicae]RMT30951.1 hypothetical protein ALP50_103372 [Pseudomonas syringae pv. spinaceae]RMP28891.1 hypothetical protein ALQ24_102886 [Pseudomonas syringae pv. antirrhini]